MREYGQIQLRFWEDPKIQNLSLGGKTLAVYLLTGPHSNSLGIYRLPKGYVQEDLKINAETVSNLFDELFKIKFAIRDEVTGWTLILNYLKYNPPANVNVKKNLDKLFQKIPKSISVYDDILIVAKRFQDCFQTVDERYRNKEPEPEQEPEQERRNSNPLPSSPFSKSEIEKLLSIFPEADIEKSLIKFVDHRKSRGLEIDLIGFTHWLQDDQLKGWNQQKPKLKEQLQLYACANCLGTVIVSANSTKMDACPNCTEKSLEPFKFALERAIMEDVDEEKFNNMKLPEWMEKFKNIGNAST